MTVVDELVTLLGIELSPQARQNVAKFTSGIDTLAKKVTVASAVIVAAASTIAAFAVKMNQTSAEMERFSRLTGISSDVVQELGFVAEQMGGSFDGMQNDLMGLLTSMNSPIPGEFNQGLFMLGISTTNAAGGLKSVDDVLMDIAGKMEGMSAQRQLQWGQKIGLSNDTISMLQLGTAEIMRMRKMAQDIPTIVNKEDLKNARLFTQQLSIISRFFKYLGQTAAASAGPALTKLTEGFLKWVKANKEFIQLGMSKIVDAVVDGFGRFMTSLKFLKDWFMKILPGAAKFGEGLMKLKNIAGLVMGALMVLAIWIVAMTWQWMLGAAAVLLLAGAVDDFLVGIQGGDSYFGDFLRGLKAWITGLEESYPNITRVVKKIRDAIRGLWDEMGKQPTIYGRNDWLEPFRKLRDFSKEVLSNFLATSEIMLALLGQGDPSKSWSENLKEAMKTSTAFKIMQAAAEFTIQTDPPAQPDMPGTSPPLPAQPAAPRFTLITAPPTHTAAPGFGPPLPTQPSAQGSGFGGAPPITFNINVAAGSTATAGEIRTEFQRTIPMLQAAFPGGLAPVGQ